MRTPDPHNRRSGVSGFTLLELLVVVAILGMLAGIALPSASMGDDRRLDTVQLSIQDAVDYARKTSYRTGVPYGVRFGTSNGGWFAVVNEVGVPLDDPLSHGDWVIRLNAPEMPVGVTLDNPVFGDRPLVVFDEKGVLEQGGSIRISTSKTSRWLALNTANPTFEEFTP